MNVARISGWLAGVAGAVVVAGWSYAIANQGRAPATTAALNLPFTQTANGALALGSLARRQAEAQRQGNASVEVNRFETRLAESAYRSDPLAVTAIGIMGMSISDAGAPKKGTAVLEAAGRLSRRSSLVANELIESAGLAGDDATFFRWLSRAMLTDEKVRNVYIAAMADATAQDRSVAALVPIVGPAPAWSGYYWSAVLARPRSMVNAAKIRLAIARGPWPKKDDMLPVDQNLVTGLVAIREFEMAQSLAKVLKRGKSGSQAASPILSGGIFSDGPIFSPFDWELSSQGNLGASIDKANKQIVVSAIPGASGFAARQLVRLDSGNYALSWVMTSEQAIAKNALTVGLQCAEEGAQEKAAPVVLTAGKHREIMSVPSSSCQWYWVSIDANVPDGAMGLDAQIGGLSLSQAAVGETAEKSVDARPNKPGLPASASEGL